MKKESLQSFLAATLCRVLRPVVRIALRGELTYKTFAELAKTVYFEVARDDFGIAGRKTNLARVAILTGMSRKECTRLKRVADAAPVEAGPMNPATRVISAWHEDPDFQSVDGSPLDLPFEGENGSVSELFRRYAGDIPAGALFSELQRIGAIESVGDELWRVVKRSFIADGFNQEKIRILGNQLSDLGNTIVHNVNVNDAEDRRIQRYVVADAVHPDDAIEFQRLAASKGQELLEEFDTWLASRPMPDPIKGKHPDPQRVGVGIYHFQNSTSRGEKS